ncbi:MAG: hypothetical protein HN344_03715 [Gammaproteobacteria bacterium]|nr:hypothetical protein [Gammaproteobacteria bacterium]
MLFWCVALLITIGLFYEATYALFNAWSVGVWSGYPEYAGPFRPPI